MAFQTVFKRYELKYMLNLEQKEKILSAMEPYMKADKYGRSTIRNIYYDTDSYLLIRRSIEKPTYKEKLRIRSYAKAFADDVVFVELKKKYKGVVYKRRLSLKQQNAMDFAGGIYAPCEKSQIQSEIEYFIDYYSTLEPKVFLSYEREAYYAKGDADFRVTFDDEILCRCSNLSLESDIYGVPILEDGKVLMEIKCAGGIPMWMANILSKEKIYKTSFSKYGTAYKLLIFPQTHKLNNTSEVTKNA